MALTHGFYSRQTHVNPDCKMVGGEKISLPDLCKAERFLHGDACSDPVQAHDIVKAVLAAGKLKYPTLWPKAKQYADSYEYATLEKLSQLGHPFPAGATALHLRSGKPVTIKGSQLGYIHYHSNSIDGMVREDCWQQFLKPQ